MNLQDMIRRAREEAARQALSGIKPQTAPSLPIPQMQDTIRAYVRAHEAAQRLSQQAVPMPSPGTKSLRGEGVAINDPITAKEVQGLRPEVQKILQGMTLEDVSKSLHQLTPWQREAAESQAAGWGDVQSSIGGALKWVGAEGTGQKLIEHAKPLQARGPTDVPDYGFKDILNPRFWSTTIARSLPFTLSLIPVGIFGQYAAGALGLTGLAAKGGAALAAKATGMGAFGKAAVGALAKFVSGAGPSAGAGSLSAVAESAMEAGGAYNDALAMGMSEEEADRVADSTFKKNVAMLGITNTLEWALGVAPIGGKMVDAASRVVPKPILRAGGTGLMEALEEAYQEWAQASSLGKDFSLGSPETRQAMMAGFAMGGGQSMIGIAQDMATQVRNKTVEKLSPEGKEHLKKSVAEKVKNGLEPEAAVSQALDEVVQTEAGEAAVEAAVQEVVQEQSQAAGLPKAPEVQKAPEVETKVPTQGARAEFQPGQVVYHPTSGMALTITDASDPALLVTQNAQGTTLKIGKGAVSLTPPSMDAPRTQEEVQKPPAVAPEPSRAVVSQPSATDSAQVAEIARPEASERVSQIGEKAEMRDVVSESGKVGIVHLTFPGTPSEDMRSRLKDQGFQWNPKAKTWYRPWLDNVQRADAIKAAQEFTGERRTHTGTVDAGKVAPGRSMLEGAPKPGEMQIGQQYVLPRDLGSLRIGLYDPKEVGVDPERFQFKTTGKGGVTSLLKGVTKWRPDLAGRVLIWEDRQGKSWIVNGHHRLELAQRLSVPAIEAQVVREADGVTESMARVRGALANIAEGRGDAIDVARFLRESGLGPEDLRAEGISLKEKTAAQGVALSGLTEQLWRAVLDGDLRTELGVVIGRDLPGDVTNQQAVAELLARLEKQGRRLTPTILEGVIAQVKSAETTITTQETLFGEDVIVSTSAVEKAEILEYVLRQLRAHKALFNKVSKGAYSHLLEKAGNVLATEKNLEELTVADMGLELVQQLAYTKGSTISEILNRRAQEMMAAQNKDLVKRETFGEILEVVKEGKALEETIGGEAGTPPIQAGPSLFGEVRGAEEGIQPELQVPLTIGADREDARTALEETRQVEPKVEPARVADEPAGDATDAMRTQTELTHDEKRIIEKAALPPTFVYRGINQAEMDFIAREGHIKSAGEYNLEGEEGRTLFAAEPERAEIYASGFIPQKYLERHKAGEKTYVLEVLNSPDTGITLNRQELGNPRSKDLDHNWSTTLEVPSTRIRSVTELTYNPNGPDPIKRVLGPEELRDLGIVYEPIQWEAKVRVGRDPKLGLVFEVLDKADQPTDIFGRIDEVHNGRLTGTYDLVKMRQEEDGVWLFDPKTLYESTEPITFTMGDAEATAETQAAKIEEQPKPTAREEWERKHAEAKKPKARVLENKAQDGVEIRFTGKPDEAVLERLRNAGFKWNGKKKIWYKKGLNEENLALARAILDQEAPTAPGSPKTGNAKADKLIVSLKATDDEMKTVSMRDYAALYWAHLTSDGAKPYPADVSASARQVIETELRRIAEEDGLLSKGSPAFAVAPTDNRTHASKVGDWVSERLRQGKGFTAPELFRRVAEAYGGTMSEGKFTVKDAYDLMELGVNKRLLNSYLPSGQDVTVERAVKFLQHIEEDVLTKIPTETKRTSESDEFQQFSTPPNIAYTAAWVANIGRTDSVLEPSAGIGGLAVWAKINDAREVVVNELSERRAALLAEMEFDRLFKENAEQLNNILPKDVKPTVVIMNPPFSATAGRMAGARNTKFAEAHIEQALKRLEPNGRLVAIVGRGMADGAPSFRDWWKKIKGEYNVRANVAIDGKNYKKYGTTFDVQLVVIDKSGPTPQGGTFTGHFEDLGEVCKALEGIRSDRARPAEQPAGEPTGEAAPTEGRGAGRPEPAVSPSTGGMGTGVRKDSPSAPRVSEPGSRILEPSGAPDVEQGGVDAEPAPERGAGRRGATGEMAEPGGVSEAEDAGGREPVRSGLPGERAGQSRGTGQGEVETAPKSEIKVGDTVYSAGTPVTVVKVNAKDPSLITVRNADGADFQILRWQVTTKKPGPTSMPEVLVESRGDTQYGEELLTSDESSPVYSRYVPQKLKIEGAQEHPSVLSESAAMAAVTPIDPTYTPDLPRHLIETGELSIAQLEPIVYAGQAHEQVLPNGERRGYFIGDGTGVGKGRTVAGIILDNMRRGRKKAVWASKNMKLLEDAVRDWTEIGGKKVDILPLSKVKLGSEINLSKGILYIPYDTLKTGLNAAKGELKKAEGQDARIDQVTEWFGKDYDGVIVLDEAHLLQNCLPMKGARGATDPAARALAGVELQKLLPNARIVYSSATGATEPANLAYTQRLGLWGEGTPFPTAENFVTQISAGGLAAMELVARDMKAMGSYIARTLSFEGCTYDTLEHQLTPQQTEVYDALAQAWQIVLQNVNSALEITGQQWDGNAKKNAMARFWSSQQRFFNQILTAMQMPSVVKAVEKDIADGNSVIMQIVNTNQAIQERQLARLEKDQDLEDLDITPRDILLQYLDRSFPTQQYEDYIDDYGNKRSRPVTDSQGNPVMNQEALAAKEKLMQEVGMIKVPDGPLEIIFDHFGVENVAEVTGRTRRVVRKPDKSGRMKRVQETWSERHCLADIASFRADKKRILIFSEAGGTGQSYHADPKTKNSRKRMHYVIQPGWKADVCVQGFGRSHRTREASQPHYVLVTTNLKGQKRFISTIARRLDQLGALTKGQRQTGSQGLFSAADNLEGRCAGDALTMFYQDLYAGKIQGMDQEMFRKMGLEKMIDAQGNLTSKSEDLRDVPKFLNRILTLESSVQNQVFDEFDSRLRRKIEQAIAAGNLDTGLEDFKADRIEVAEEKTVFTDQRTKAETKYLGLDVYHRVKTNDFDTILSTSKKVKGFKGFYRNTRSGNVYAFFPSKDKTLHTGEVVRQYAQVSQVEGDINRITEDQFKKGNWEELSAPEARMLWEEALAKTSEFKKEKLHLITGTILPIWDRLPGGHQKVYRVKTDDGKQFLGRKLNEHEVDITLERLGASRTKQALAPAQMLDKVITDNATIHLSNGWRIVRRKVSGETRLEILGDDFYNYYHELDRAGAFSERINWQTRYFIPVGESGVKVFEAITKYRPVSSVDMPEAMSTERRQAIRTVESAGGGGDALADLDSIQSELESELDSQISRSTDLRIVPEAVARTIVPPKRSEVDGYWIQDEEVKKRWLESDGVKTLTTKDKLKAAWEDFCRKATREFEFLPRTAEFAEIRKELLQLLKQPDVQNMRTLIILEGLVKDVVMDDVKWTLFEGGVVFNDLRHEYEAGHDLPYGIRRDQFEKIKAALDREIAKYPEVQKAINERKAVWKAIVRAYVQAMETIGYHVEQRFLDENGDYREDYFHHQVLQHVNANYGRYVQGMGQALKTPTGRGWMKKRAGSDLDINRNYVEAEFEVMAQMLFDIQKAKALALVQSPKYNIIEECRKAAKKANEAAIEALIMAEKAGYAKDHPRAKNLKSDIETELNKMRGRIAWAFGQLRDMAAQGDLWDGDRHEFRRVVQGLASAQDIDVDPTMQDRTFEFLAALKNSDNEGSMQAATVLKNVSERRQFTRDTLGGEYKTWEDMIPEGYMAFQPREGNVFYMTSSIPEKIAEEIATGLMDAMDIEPDQVKRIMAVGGARPSYVIREEIALTLERPTRIKSQEPVAKLGREMVRAWKAHQLLGPTRITKYQLRNISGDAEIVAVGNPSAFKKVREALEALFRVFYKGAPMTGELKQCFERGLFQSTQQVQDLGDVNQYRAFRHLVERKGGLQSVPERMWRKYWDAAHTSSTFRESVLRYAAYLDYLEQMQSNKEGRPKNFGASIPEEIMALPDIRDRAYTLANQLLGAYDQVSVAGQMMADSLAPFWRFQEVNMKRYMQLYKNAVSEGRTGEVAARSMKTVLKKSPMLAWKSAKFAAKAGFFWAMLQAYNMTLWRDEEEELSADVRGRPHIVLGRNPDGTVKYFDRLGVIGDFVEWFSMDAPQQVVSDWLSGHITMREALMNMAKAPVNKLWQSLSWVKIAAEAVSGKKTFPDMFDPRPIRDKWQYLFDQFGLGEEYKHLAGLPHRPYMDRLQNLLVYTDDPGEGSYYDTLDQKRQFLKKIGKATEFTGTTSPRSSALYNLKLALRYQDKDALEKYLAEYIQLGGTAQGLKTSLRNMNPLHGLNDAQKQVFITEWLDDAGRERLGQAILFYETVLLGKPREEDEE